LTKHILKKLDLSVPAGDILRVFCYSKRKGNLEHSENKPMLVYQEGNFAKNGKAHEFRETEQNLIRKFKFQKKRILLIHVEFYYINNLGNMYYHMEQFSNQLITTSKVLNK
jgi:hypothetical protein